MALTTAQLIGTPANTTNQDLNEAVTIGKKATGGASAIAYGRVVFLTHATGVWAIATAGSTGRMGIVPKLAPINLDAEDTLQVVTAVGAEYYVEGNSAAKPGAQLIPDTGGKLKATTGQQGAFIYKGHYGEGSGLENDPTDGATGEAWRVEVTGQVI